MPRRSRSANTAECRRGRKFGSCFRCCRGRSKRRGSTTLKKTFKKVLCYSLHPRVGTLRLRPVSRGMLITRRGAEAVGPPDRRGVEHNISLRAGINRRRRCALGATAGPFALGGDLQARNVGGVAMPFPADQARNAVAVLHRAAGKEPVLLVGTNPVGPTGNRKGAASADQRGLVGSVVFQVAQLGKARL